MPLNKPPELIESHLRMTMPILCALLSNPQIIPSKALLTNACIITDLVKRSQQIAGILLTVIDEESLPCSHEIFTLITHPLNHERSPQPDQRLQT